MISAVLDTASLLPKSWGNILRMDLIWHDPQMGDVPTACFLSVFLFLFCIPRKARSPKGVENEQKLIYLR